MEYSAMTLPVANISPYYVWGDICKIRLFQTRNIQTTVQEPEKYNYQLNLTVHDGYKNNHSNYKNEYNQDYRSALDHLNLCCLSRLGMLMLQLIFSLLVIFNMTDCLLFLCTITQLNYRIVSKSSRYGYINQDKIVLYNLIV